MSNKIVVGMLHLPPLPGSVDWRNKPRELSGIVDRTVEEAQIFADAGFDAVMLENFGDAPFYPGEVPPITIACMTRIAAAVRSHVPLQMGINVLRNDGESALAIALAAQAQFIRVNVLCGARVTDQGLIQGIAHRLLRLRASLDSTVQIWADVNVKHSAPLATRSIMDEVADLAQRGHADAVIVSGSATGKAVNPNELNAVKAAANERPVIVGSGVSAETIPQLAAQADGFIVGSSLKTDGRVDADKVRRFAERIKKASP